MIKKIQDAKIKKQTVVLRLDLNIPYSNGKTSDISRIEKTKKTIQNKRYEKIQKTKKNHKAKTSKNTKNKISTKKQTLKHNNFIRKIRQAFRPTGVSEPRHRYCRSSVPSVLYSEQYL